MNSGVQSSSSPGGRRKRRAHRKSRAGCRNCKLRRVKCDETRPACLNCSGLLVACNYDKSAANKPGTTYDDDLSFSVSAVKLANDAFVTIFNETVSPQYPQAAGMRQCRPLTKWDMDRLKRFHTRTVFTLGPPEICARYQQYVSKDVSQYPYLLHTILATTVVHDRYQGLGQTGDDCTMETQFYHLGHAAALFKDRLTRPCTKTVDRNAMWITASLLNHMSASAITTWDPESSWPLAPEASFEPHLDWFNMSQGLPVIYHLAAPIEPGGMFHGLFEQTKHEFLRDKWKQDNREGIDGIPFSFISLCGLSVSSNADNNPYHAAVRALIEIWDMEHTKYTAFRFMSFISLLRPEMKALLQQKDPCALLILAYWYTKMFDLHLWLHQRSVVECTAISHDGYTPAKEYNRPYVAPTRSTRTLLEFQQRDYYDYYHIEKTNKMEDEDLLAPSKAAPASSEASTAPVSPDLLAVDSDEAPITTPGGSASPNMTPGNLSRTQSFSNSSSSYQEDWETFPLDKMSIFDMFDTFALTQKIEKWQQTINIQRERVRKQRQKLKSVSDLAKDRVVDQLKKRVPTAEEQLEKYRGRMRNSVDRLNKQWNQTATVTLREKISFLCGVMNIFISGYIIGAYPEYFYWWYTVQLFYYMPIRLYTYHKQGYHYFLADLCYFVNLLSMLSIWVVPQSKRLLIGTICLAYGNNAVAIAMWRNSLVFHSHDKIVSVFVHIMPPVAFHCITHMTSPEMLKQRFPAVYDVKFSEPGAPEHFTLPAMMLWASIPYAVWQITYHRFITVRRAEKIAAGRPTSYTWLRKSYSRTWIGKFVLGLPQVLQEPAFMAIQYLYALLTMIPCPLWFWYRWASSAFVTIMFMWSIHNGATYYIDVFGKRFEKELEAVKRDVAKWQSSADISTSPVLNPDTGEVSSSMLSDLLDSPPTPPAAAAAKASLEQIPSLEALTSTTSSQPGAPDAASELRNRSL